MKNKKYSNNSKLKRLLMSSKNTLTIEEAREKLKKYN
jgi:hypothetical protein